MSTQASKGPRGHPSASATVAEQQARKEQRSSPCMYGESAQGARRTSCGGGGGGGSGAARRRRRKICRCAGGGRSPRRGADSRRRGGDERTSPRAESELLLLPLRPCPALGARGGPGPPGGGPGGPAAARARGLRRAARARRARRGRLRRAQRHRRYRPPVCRAACAPVRGNPCCRPPVKWLLHQFGARSVNPKVPPRVPGVRSCLARPQGARRERESARERANRYKDNTSSLQRAHPPAPAPASSRPRALRNGNVPPAGALIDPARGTSPATMIRPMTGDPHCRVRYRIDHGPAREIPSEPARPSAWNRAARDS